jgi:hypothetical protein
MMHQNVLDDIDIRQFKLINGDEIIAFVQGIDIESDGYILENPVQVNYSLHSEDATQEYYLTTWMTFADLTKPFFIDQSKVITSGQVVEEVKLRYIKMVTNVNEPEEPKEVDEQIPLMEDIDETIH